MKKIMILANDSVGLYLFRQDLIAKLLENNKVITCMPDTGFIKEIRQLGCGFINISMERRGINPVKDFRLLFQYYKLLKTQNPELVITYTIKPNIYGGVICRLYKISYAVNITGLGTAFQGNGMLRKLVTIMYKVGLKKAKIVFFENEENRQIFINEKIVNEKQTCLLNGAGVNLEHYQVTEYPADDGTIRFLFIGRIMKEKGIDELFVAMKRLRADGISCTLDILGSYEENYAGKIKEYEKEGWLYYHGYQKDVRPFIKKCHCFVLPSWHEGMANTNLECAAMGRPVITSNIHGCKEAIIHKKTGFYCGKKDSESLYKAMRYFCSIDYARRKAMGLAGRKRMEDVFDKNKVVRETLDVLRLEEV